MINHLSAKWQVNGGICLCHCRLSTHQLKKSSLQQLQKDLLAALSVNMKKQQFGWFSFSITFAKEDKMKKRQSKTGTTEKPFSSSFWPTRDQEDQNESLPIAFCRIWRLCTPIVSSCLILGWQRSTTICHQNVFRNCLVQQQKKVSNWELSCLRQHWLLEQKQQTSAFLWPPLTTSQPQWSNLAIWQLRPPNLGCHGTCSSAKSQDDNFLFQF